jgi:hypothetical protein
VGYDREQSERQSPQEIMHRRRLSILHTTCSYLPSPPCNDFDSHAISVFPFFACLPDGSLKYTITGPIYKCTSLPGSPAGQTAIPHYKLRLQNLSF